MESSWTALISWFSLLLFIYFVSVKPLKKLLGSFSEILSIPFFLLCWTYLYWIWGSFFHLPDHDMGIYITFLLTCVGLHGVTWNSTSEKMAYDYFGIFIFVLFFVGGVVVRAWSPYLNVAERLPDMALFQTCYYSPNFPPQDLWLSGNTINYYYFGQLLFVPLTKITHIPLEVAFNLATCTIWGFIASSAYAVARMLNVNWVAGIAAGFASALLSNWKWIHQMIEKGTQGGLFWWDSSRAIPGTITEFPFFSFLLGDFHAHFIAIPFLSLTVAFLIRVEWKKWSSLLFAALCVGLHYPLNPWEFPWVALFALIILRKNLKSFFLIGLGAGVIFLPFWINYERPVSFFGWVPWNLWSPPILFVLHWGIFIVPLGMLLCLGGRKLCKKENWVSNEGILLLVSLGAILFCEFIHLDDFYGPALKRMNTVFKFYTFGWWGLSIAVPVLLFRNQDLWKTKKSFRILFTMFVGLSLVYPLFAPNTRLIFDSHVPTLNGMANWNEISRGEEEAVQWLRQNTDPQDVILEATGPAYDRFGRFSALSGRPTVLGWSNHEWIWRKNGHELTEKRTTDFSQINQDVTGNTFLPFLKKYKVRWILLGDLELKNYSAGLLSQIQKLPKRFDQGMTSIYEVHSSF